MSAVVPPDATPYVQGFPSFTTRVIFGQWIYTDGSPVTTPPTISYVGAPFYLSAVGVTMFAKPITALLAAPIGDSTVGVWWAEVLVYNDPDVVGDVAVRISHPVLPTGSIIIAVPSGSGPLNIANALQVVGSQGGLMVVGGGAGGPINLDLTVRAAFLATASATEHAVTIYQKNTSGTGSGLNEVSDNPDTSSVQISGIEKDKGTVKITHRKPSGIDDGTSAALSIDLQDGAGNGGSAAQGIVVIPTEGATTGNLILLRNNGRDDFVVKGSGRVGVGIPIGATPAGQVEIAQPTTADVALAMTAIASGAQLILLKDSGGNARFEVTAAGNAVLRAIAYFTSSIQVGSATSDLGGGAGVLSMKNATTVPNTNPTGGVILYVEGGVLKYRDPSGNIITLGAVGAHTHAAADITSGTLDIARMTPGSRLTLIWDDAQSRWEDTAGAAVSARPGSRNDILLDLIGGLETDRPAWANQQGDMQFVTQTP